ncbi:MULTISPECIES: Coq4 family protein [unclassified Anabaena]|uniref:Coq4 family protein n=1 Tax=unclassified Anabaena TaxID=2619674 RepID=UPI0039C5D6C6
MATIKRFIKAIKDYYTLGQAGDIAFLKFEMFGMSANPDVVAQMQDLAGYYPSIDLEELRQLPEGTLGYEYAQHMLKNGIQPLEISADLREEASLSPFGLRYTLTHDVFHVLLGFDTSYAGEMGVAAFMIAQDYSKLLNVFNPVMTFLYPLIFRSQGQQMRSNIRRGKALGEQATCLLAYRFEENWGRAIADIRAELGLILADEQLERQSNQAIAKVLSKEGVVA